MGPAETPAVRECQNCSNRDLQQKIDDAAVFDVPLEIDRTSLATQSVRANIALSVIPSELPEGGLTHVI